MQLRLRFLLSSAGLMLLSQAPVAGAVSLVPMEEPVTTLVSPPNANPFVPSMQYAFSGSSLIATTVTSTPLLCANTSAPLFPGTTLNPVYYSATGIGSSSPRPFVFGASPSFPNVSVQASGATSVAMSPTSMTFSGDASGSLVCYGLDSSGARRLTRDVFMDGLDGVPYNSTIVLTVFHAPTSGTDYYGYKIDVTLPPLPVDTDQFALIEGFDSAVFATTAGESTAGIQGTWCQSLDGQSCAFAPNAGNINFSYANGTNNSLLAPVSPNPAVQYHFIVKRYLRTGIASVPATGAPLVIAALFSPNDLEENKLDDNVAVGN
jgi:hypothetical protein